MTLLTELANNCLTFSIDYNEHLGFYESSNYYYMGNFSYVNLTDWNAPVWSIQVYPNTPVSFYSAVSNNLDSLIEWAIKESKEARILFNSKGEN